MSQQQQKQREGAREEDNVALRQQNETIHPQHHKQQTAGGADRACKYGYDADGEGQQQNGEEEGGTNIKTSNRSEAKLKQQKRSYSLGAFTDNKSRLWRYFENIREQNYSKFRL
ncbi:hypothetical protein PsorP6_014098 [Peronosclerospora sorghi]|uniref:Uncharacterized protein n=1 Tax=Peronosclerospora sorghi TaxID=230839 RepID=A0ACC0VI76_9STRA|nr:hypothetical protein PsorP6_014098 [Peronosclerospora sorghi]